MPEYICMKTVDTNEYPNIFVSKFRYERIFESKIFVYSNIFSALWTRLAPALCFYNLNSIFDQCYQQNNHKQSVIYREIKQILPEAQRTQGIESIT